MVPDLLLGHPGARLSHDNGVYPFAPEVVGHCDDSAIRDRRMRRHSILHLGGIHVLTAGDDHVFEPVDDVDVAVMVHPPSVAGVHPATAQRRGGLRGSAQ